MLGKIQKYCICIAEHKMKKWKPEGARNQPWKTQAVSEQVAQDEYTGWAHPAWALSPVWDQDEALGLKEMVALSSLPTQRHNPQMAAPAVKEKLWKNTPNGQPFWGGEQESWACLWNEKREIRIWGFKLHYICVLRNHQKLHTNWF